MSEMLAFCGIDCSACGAYKATVADDNVLRAKTAEEWSKAYNAAFNAEDINCLGCKSDIRIGHCGQCDVRTCGISHSVNNCAECDDFGCKKNTDFMNMVPDARSNLERVREKL
jgi:hypothetical protein